MSLDLKDNTLLKTHALIDGQWVKSSDQTTFEVLNPSDGKIIANVYSSGTLETSNAINSAELALKSWRKLTAKQRSSLLMKWYDLIAENIEDLTQILTAEQGKPLAEARGEIKYGANYIKWFAEEAKRIYGDTIPHTLPGTRILVTKQPIGVVACITPWNFPNAMLARKIAPALAAGNTVVCKPANETPLSALALGELAHRAGIPAGVINIVCGKTTEIGEELTSNPIVRKLTFTGSTAVGKKLTADSARTMKRTSMELGGNAPFIIFNDADVNDAIAGLMISKFRNAGQTCVCANRIFVQSGIYDQFVKAVKIAISKLKVGDGTEAGTQIGPLINERASKNVRALILDAHKKGADVLTAEESPTGNFIAPTLLLNTSDDMRVFKEEIFGPVAPIIKFETEEEVIRAANNTPVGLAAYFYARDIGLIWRVSEALDFGMVGVNTGTISDEMIPFGGMKESGQGREGSRYGLDDYLEMKSLTIGGIDK
ncbi:NAD-dependent succinate-semialdehyde dehydrogenase [Hirschia litorea]|uniref:NAD-dependent succinate-semialdehyde dehydrogenase n=1 Tax=Hirschia litorea TaxID=1199156 RepID=A0ABW2IPC3_9PROT